MNRKLFVIIPIVLLSMGIIASVSFLGNNATANDGTTDEIPVPREIPENVTALFGKINTTALVDIEAPREVDLPDNGIASGGSMTPEEFLLRGGTAAIVVTGDGEKVGPDRLVTVARGESVTVPINLNYANSPNAEKSLTVAGIEVMNGYIPAETAEKSSPEERAREFMETGKITGMYDLSSTIELSPSQVTLAPGDAAVAEIVVTIPKDWSDDTVGDDIIYNIQFHFVGDHDSSSDAIFADPLLIHIAS